MHLRQNCAQICNRIIWCLLVIQHHKLETAGEIVTHSVGDICEYVVMVQIRVVGLMTCMKQLQETVLWQTGETHLLTDFNAIWQSCTCYHRTNH